VTRVDSIEVLSPIASIRLKPRVIERASSFRQSNSLKLNHPVKGSMWRAAVDDFGGAGIRLFMFEQTAANALGRGFVPDYDHASPLPASGI
jgi:hypothetical protein